MSTASSNYFGMSFVEFGASFAELASFSFLRRVTQLDRVDTFGRTALHIAAQGGRTNALREILGRPIDVDSRDSGGQTALHHAALSGKVGVTTTGWTRVFTRSSTFFHVGYVAGFQTDSATAGRLVCAPCRPDRAR